ncbi:MAG: hypothetical protein KAG93_04880 [Desulfuromusa sp.]|nr:hypothetical protein [Desulfuromusa sp.]
MKKLIILITLAILLVSSNSFSAGFMKDTDPRVLGHVFGESILRFSAMVGATNNNMSVDQLVEITEVLIRAGYIAGKYGEDLEDGIQNYINAYDKAYNKGR